MWVRKFTYVATTTGYHDVFLGITVVPPQEKILDENASNGKAKLRGRRRE